GTAGEPAAKDAESGTAGAPGAEEPSGTVSGEGETGATSEAGTAAATATGQVPRTGLDVALVVALGLLLVAIGVSVRRLCADL
ncbi:MAG TPA: hypothetical protein VJT75_17970, partial [Thermoleophilaceae bacterium]|nr:hypothetical protein [Thermoleophilaceae bacterium]